MQNWILPEYIADVLPAEARKIEELRSFEKDYRGRLKGFISEQLEKLEHTAVDPAADQAEGDAIFRTSFPRISRAEFPPGRGLLVEGGKTRKVQIALPD